MVTTEVPEHVACSLPGNDQSFHSDAGVLYRIAWRRKISFALCAV